MVLVRLIRNWLNNPPCFLIMVNGNGLYLYSAFLVVTTTQSAFTLHGRATTQGANLLIRGKITIHSHTIGAATGDI